MSNSDKDDQSLKQHSAGADFASFDLLGGDDDDASQAAPSPAAQAPAASDGAADPAQARSGAGPSAAPDPERAAESGAGSPQPAAEQPEKPEGAAERGVDPRQRDGILAELREEREERRRLSAQNAELAAALREIAAERRSAAARPAAEPEPEAVPDPLHDPAGYDAYIERRQQAALAQVQRQVEEVTARSRFDVSRSLAEQRHGAETVQKAIAWVQAQGEAAGRHFTAQRDPVGAALAAYNRSQTLARVGDDPDAYERSVEAKVLARLRAAGIVIPDAPAAPGAAPVAQGQPQPARAPVLPPALAAQPRGGRHGTETEGSFTDFASSFIND